MNFKVITRNVGQALLVNAFFTLLPSYAKMIMAKKGYSYPIEITYFYFVIINYSFI